MSGLRMFRVEPQMPAANYKTYQILAPRLTHWRDATCAEVQCAAHVKGWTTVADERTDLGMGHAYYIRKQSGRAFKESRDEHGMTVFVFTPGQRCFRSNHQVRIERPEIYVVKGGDWRGNPRGIDPRIHARPSEWVDDFAGHQDRLATRLRQG